MSGIIRSRWALAAVGSALLASGVFAATPASANHYRVQAFVDFERNGQLVSEYPSEVVSGCGSTSCNFSMFLPGKKNYAQFLRWCGSDTVVVTTAAGASSGISPPCLGSGRWQIRVRVELTAESGSLATHPDATSTTLRVTNF